MSSEIDAQLDLSQNTLTLHIKGRVDTHTTASLWQESEALLQQHPAKHLTIQAAAISYCDSIGMIYLSDLMAQFKQSGDQRATIQDLPPRFQKLYDQITQLPATVLPSQEAPLHCIERCGQKTRLFFGQIKASIQYLGKLFLALAHTLKHPRTLRRSETIRIMRLIGPDAVPLAALIGILFGIIISFQSAIQLKLFGAQIYVANLVSLGLFRELGPLMTAIILAGRSASAFAAELSTMKLNQELDALNTMGLSPTFYLVIPRVVAAAIITPLLSLVVDLFGLLGCTFIMLTQSYAPSITIQQMKQTLSVSDITTGLFKALVFGIIIAAIGCYNGCHSETHPGAVGTSTTRTVVLSLVMIIFIDGIFTSIFYAMGL